VARRLSGERLVRRSSGEDAARYIQRLIFDGHLTPGGRVPQNEVARALGVSRIPVREALIALERAGWVTIELHRGAFVSVLDEQAVRDHYELCGIVYALAARRAVARGPDGWLDPLADAASSLALTDEPTRFHELVVAFDAAVTAASRSPRIHVALRALSGIVPGNLFELVPAAMEVEREGVRSIAAALRDGDGDAAGRGYERMMCRQSDNVVDVLRERGVLR
jgi:DNA-binding GntR family transcriptional regulator